MKHITTILIAAIIALGTTSVFAAKEKAAKPAKAEKAKVELVDLELSGTLVKKERTVKNKKDNTEKTVAMYALKTDTGMVRLPSSKDIDFTNLVDQAVTVTGKGFTKGEGDKAKTFVKTVSEVKASN
ncbi:MAG: hypothetical protein ACI8W8_001250 [Rhodothermales bacterium]|jgi:hypothetical protein